MLSSLLVLGHQDGTSSSNSRSARLHPPDKLRMFKSGSCGMDSIASCLPHFPDFLLPALFHAPHIHLLEDGSTSNSMDMSVMSQSPSSTESPASFSAAVAGLDFRHSTTRPAERC